MVNIVEKAPEEAPGEHERPAGLEKKNLFQRREVGASRDELKHALRNSHDLSGRFPEGERIKMESELFPTGKFGEHISERDVDKTISKLSKEKHAAAYEEQKTIQHKIDILENLKKPK